MTEQPASITVLPKYRWLLCGLLFFITVNNYMDRQLLSIVTPAISKEFHLKASDIALIIDAFLITYGIGQIFSGRFMDWIGPRRGFSLSVLIWSLAGICTSFARSVFAFGFYRLLLGAAESGNFPGAIKVITEWFPPEERTTAVGIFTSGVSIGAVLTPPLAAYLIVHYGWQFAFVAVGFPGLLWILIWRATYRPAKPCEAPRLLGEPVSTEAERSGVAMRQWSFLLKQRQSWGVILGRFFAEPVGWLYYSWLPLYLNRFLGVTLMNTGLLLMIPFIAQDAGFLLGGGVASRLIRMGWPVDKTRKWMIFGSGLCMTSAIASIFAPSPLVFILLISSATFGHGSLSSNLMSMPGDIVPYEAVGTLYGLSGAGGSLGSIVFTTIIGRLIDVQNSFDTVFVIGGILPLVAATVMFNVGGKVQRLPSLQLAAAPLAQDPTS